MSDPPVTIFDMGEVVSLESFRRARAQRGAAGTSVPDPGGLVGTVERLALAVRALEDALTGSEAYDEGEVRSELVALNGAVALGRYGFAASRTERLVERLRSG